MDTDSDGERALVRRLARKAGRSVRGGKVSAIQQPGLPPLLTWAPGQEPLPVCEYPTIDAGDHNRKCGRIATHRSWLPSKPSGERDYCAYHAIKAAADGETFEPAEWLQPS